MKTTIMLSLVMNSKHYVNKQSDVSKLTSANSPKSRLSDYKKVLGLERSDFKPFGVWGHR